MLWRSIAIEKMLPAVPTLRSSSVLGDHDLEFCCFLRVGRAQADSGPANILICGPIVRWTTALYLDVAEPAVTPALFDQLALARGG